MTEEKVPGWPLIVTSWRIVTLCSFVVILLLVKTDFKEEFEAYVIFSTLREIHAFNKFLILRVYSANNTAEITATLI